MSHVSAAPILRVQKTSLCQRFPGWCVCLVEHTKLRSSETKTRQCSASVVFQTAGFNTLAILLVRKEFSGLVHGFWEFIKKLLSKSKERARAFHLQSRVFQIPPECDTEWPCKRTHMHPAAALRISYTHVGVRDGNIHLSH